MNLVHDMYVYVHIYVSRGERVDLFSLTDVSSALSAMRIALLAEKRLQKGITPTLSSHLTAESTSTHAYTEMQRVVPNEQFHGQKGCRKPMCLFLAPSLSTLKDS